MNNNPDNIMFRSPEVLLCEALLEKNMKIATAESCTGGMIAAKITAVPGASGCFDCGVVTYSNEQKQKLLGVNAKTLEKFGAVSKETALEMCKGAKIISGADVAVSVTGIAGPGGGTPEKPVGTVWIGVCGKNVHQAFRFLFKGDRNRVRQQTAMIAIEMARRAVLGLDVDLRV
ncbi:MAG: CinA family protein [Clostridia bacterium]|nr:CinA family protein [Clostridia bacterium]